MRLFAALRHRDFRLFYLGQSVSHVGDALFFMALAWEVLEMRGDATAVGYVTGAYMLAQVALLLVGGVVVDRFPRRALILASDVAQGLLAAALAGLAFAGLLSFPVLLTFALLFGAASALAMPAMGAFLPETVPAPDLASAQSLYQGTHSVALMAGPLLGGLLLAGPGAGAAFAVDAATFAFSVAMTLLLRASPLPPRREWTMLRDVGEGLRYVAARPWLWMTILAFSIINVVEAGPRNVALPVLVRDELRLDASAYGLVLAASAAGGLLGLVLAGSRPPPARRRGLVAYAATTLGGAFFLLLAFAPSLSVVLALSFLRAASVAVFSIIWETTLGDSVDRDVRGRVISLDMLGSFAFLPLAMAGTGVFTDAFGARWAFAGGGAVWALVGFAGLLIPAARRFRRSEEA